MKIVFKTTFMLLFLTPQNGLYNLYNSDLYVDEKKISKMLFFFELIVACDTIVELFF